MRQHQWIAALTPALLLLGIASFTAPAAAAPAAKIEVCHFPPGNPDNFHTITISEKAFAAHLAHGDLGGACNALCAMICDDENACTIDDTADCEEVGCPTSSTPVDCNDQNECTADSCEPASGCVTTARTGATCDDDQVCSGPDTCDAEGACNGPDIDNCCLGDEACSQNPCDGASCNLDTNRCDEDPVACEPPDLCTISGCASDTGECVGAAVVCGEGETCNPATGICDPDVVCPCWTQAELDAVGAGGDLCRITGALNGSARILSGVNLNNKNERAVVTTVYDESGDVIGRMCDFLLRPATVRTLAISEAEYTVCGESILTECEDRGMPLPPLP